MDLLTIQILKVCHVMSIVTVARFDNGFSPSGSCRGHSTRKDPHPGPQDHHEGPIREHC